MRLAVLLVAAVFAVKASAAIQTLEEIQIGDELKSTLDGLQTLCSSCGPIKQATGEITFNTKISTPFQQIASIVNLKPNGDKVGQFSILYQFKTAEEIKAAFEAQKKQFEATGLTVAPTDPMVFDLTTLYHAGPVDHKLAVITDEGMKLYLLSRVTMPAKTLNLYQLKAH